MTPVVLPTSHRPNRGGLRCPLWLVATLLFAASIVLAPRAAAGDDPPPTQPDAVADLEALQRAFQRVVDQVAPSVVGIRAQRHRVTTLPGANPGDKPETIEQELIVNGSGTVIGEDGLILTSEHVVQGASDIQVLFADGQQSRGTVWAADARADLAVLRVSRTDTRPVQMCDWETVARGQWSVVIGNPFGLGRDGQLSVSVGVIANLGRQLPGLGEVDDRFYHDMLQITAPINPGNSGGPLFNIRGELIGIVTAMHTRAPADEGIGFAIPMSPAKRRVVETLCQGRPIEYGYLGVVVRALEAAERAALHLGHGAVVQQIEPNGPAAQAGLSVGDLVLEFEHQPVTGPAQFAELAGQSAVGSAVQLDVLRDGRMETLRLVVERRDVSRVSWMRGNAITWRGMRLTDLSPDARRHMRVDSEAQGVVIIEVELDSPAGRAALRVGDVIEAAGGAPVRDTYEFLARVRGAEGPLVVSVRKVGSRSIEP
jgi:serine protease Do